MHYERDVFQVKVLEAIEVIKAQVNELRDDCAIWKKSMDSDIMPMEEAPKVNTPNPNS